MTTQSSSVPLDAKESALPVRSLTGEVLLGSLQKSGALLSRVWRWIRDRQAIRTSTRRLQVAATASLGEKRFVAVIQMDGLEFLVGGGASNVVLLAQLNSKDKFNNVLQNTIASRVEEPSDPFQGSYSGFSTSAESPLPVSCANFHPRDENPFQETPETPALEYKSPETGEEQQRRSIDPPAMRPKVERLINSVAKETVRPAITPFINRGPRKTSNSAAEPQAETRAARRTSKRKAKSAAASDATYQAQMPAEKQAGK